MYESLGRERSLETTSTWAVAVVCLVLVSISLLVEHALEALGKWLRRLNKAALLEALEKIKTELMLMGLISLLLTLGQGLITSICISPSIAATWLPFRNTSYRRHLQNLGSSQVSRSVIEESPIDKCSEKGKVAFVSAAGIHQLHYFIFVLAVFHVIYCMITYLLGRSKMRKWKAWEEETKMMMQNQDINDPERLRIAKDTSFGRRHLQTWSRPLLSLWIVCFFRQFTRSVTKVDYRTLRHGFITAHLAPGSETRFEFQNYINRSLEHDFKEVVGIRPFMWLMALLFLLSNTYELHSYLWLPFIPLLMALVVGTKLQVIITRMGLRIQDTGNFVKGALVVQPEDDLFWFGRPRFILFLIHWILFQNAFQLAFVIWSWWKLGASSCFNHQENFVIRITMGVLIQVLISYVTLPLYALVTQMGSQFRLIIFNERIVTALKNWHQAAKKRVRDRRQSEVLSQTYSAPVTPSYGESPEHDYWRNIVKDSEKRSEMEDYEDRVTVLSFEYEKDEDEEDYSVENHASSRGLDEESLASSAHFRVEYEIAIDVSMEFSEEMTIARPLVL